MKRLAKPDLDPAGELQTMSILEESSYVRIWLDKGRDEGKYEHERLAGAIQA